MLGSSWDCLLYFGGRFSEEVHVSHLFTAAWFVHHNAWKKILFINCCGTAWSRRRHFPQDSRGFHDSRRFNLEKSKQSSLVEFPRAVAYKPYMSLISVVGPAVEWCPIHIHTGQYVSFPYLVFLGLVPIAPGCSPPASQVLHRPRQPSYLVICRTGSHS